ncbi:hypothetical protein KPN_04688 [Klebsiella pneumoniae subsp. pneumoniae MGH 78578]|uniref:Uncharacterized protein n=1 Tax=Klebsiella pneumoniae subsp. pneumoniae (strain ATCC 700721 / MGH 78578) TaxID=272620 RepID=A6THK4_KLEP7|nr:hypothetical protein KPN_04688 [Klebsiella pneumoniae subsp. pneumoniae MGH 78578]
MEIEVLVRMVDFGCLKHCSAGVDTTNIKVDAVRIDICAVGFFED